MSTTVLGISAFYHDSAAAIVTDGQIIAAAQEERFSRKKHDPRFPRHAINYCLAEAFVEPEDLDAIVFYDHPLITLDRVLRSHVTVAPRSAEQWTATATGLLGVKMFVEQQVREMLGTGPRFLFTEHHAAHAASAS